jgi:hypothetical protein
MCAIAPDEWAGRPMQLPYAEADFPRSLPTLDELPLSHGCRIGVVTNLCCQGGRVGTRRRYYLALDGCRSQSANESMYTVSKMYNEYC